MEANISTTTRMGPSNATQQITSKPESPSSQSLFDEESEVLHHNMIKDKKQNVFGQSRKSDYLKHAIFLTNRSLRMTENKKPSQFVINFRKQYFVHRFINNLFTNLYFMKSDQKLKIMQTLDEKPAQQFAKDNSRNSKNNKWIFLPSTHFIMIWDILGLLFHLIMLWVSPFLCSFQEFNNSIIKSLQSIILFYLVFDILVMFNRAIIREAVIVCQRKDFIKNYLKSNAIYDFANLAIWIFLKYEFHQLYYFQECLIIFQRYITEYFQQIYCRGNQSFTIDLVSLIIQIYYFAHIIACIWHYVGSQTESLGNSWLIDNHLENKSSWSKYNAAFYWATMTMTTVGYGDVVAVNEIEMIVASIVMFCSSCAFAYTMSSIGIILKNIYDTQLNYKKNLIQITQFMLKNNVDEQIQGRIRNYLNSQLYQEKKENMDDVNNILNSLPFNLQQDLNADIQHRVIKQIKLIINHFSKSTQIQVAKNLQLISLLTGDVVYKQGDLSEDSLYFIHKGEVKQTELQTKTTLKTLQKNQYLGIYSFFTGFCPKETAICNSPTEIYKINRKKFLEIIRSNQKDHEIFNHIKDKIIFTNNLVLFDHKCHFCNRPFHLEIDCPLIQYKPDLEQILKKENFTVKHNFRVFKKRKNNKYSTLGQLNKLTQSLNQFQEDQQIQLFGLNENNQIEIPRQRTGLSEVVYQNSPQMIGQNNQNLSGISDEEQHSEFQHNSQQQPKQQIQQSAIKIQHRSSIQKVKLTKLEHRTSKSNFAPNTDNLNTSFSILDEVKHLLNYQNTFNLDKVNFTSISYMPQYSLESQLKQMAKTIKRKNQRLQRLHERFDKYTFFYQAKELSLKLRLFYKRSNKSTLL
ncbi:unnamed protein product (macronuclear) [Paramecium tetraurelia]|uniref:Chromosome undetermined scaffold_1, whole genome shotgun sequence n=1 Tax=Paramecium tetraurelia TaxID=5888 RepID=Q6BGA9_PARTE|nr:K+ channel [Paramecium tetraurelia strain d4-2]XP_001423390.1 uncharacterized protein GSPATT00000427001 [Paramecium tetraurelia]CAH03311.1 K+ channel, putative [Paramecium tetraurelia]CAK55992.1 unnamed protein product [Paramecium tetraurelia]|eukprot:XP_001423390.1 hypothetical protein (macronuclear) [Paramecium tetraurelia strain d4-2]